MALTSPFQVGTVILVLVAVLEALLYLRNRQRAIDEARREGALHDLESGRRLLGMAKGRAARGNHEAAVRICGRARMILSEARRRAIDTGDRKTEALVRAELARCTVTTENSLRRFREGQKQLRRAPDGRLDARRLVHIEMLLEEAEGLSLSAGKSFAAGNFIDARDLYTSIRSRLSEARRAAVEAGSLSYVKLIDTGLAEAQRGLASTNAWVLDGRPVLETQRRQQVKGVISPYFKREDGSFEPRPR